MQQLTNEIALLAQWPERISVSQLAAKLEMALEVADTKCAKPRLLPRRVEMIRGESDLYGDFEPMPATPLVEYERVLIEEVIGAMRETLEQAYGCWMDHYGINPEGSPTPLHITRLEMAISMLCTGLAKEAIGREALTHKAD